MKILFIADGRSPTAKNWIRHFVNAGKETHLVSMFPCDLNMNVASTQIVPIAFSNFSVPEISGMGEQESFRRRILRLVATPKLRTLLRHWFVPRSLYPAAKFLASIIRNLQPDIIHAMRIPYEGMLGALACEISERPGPSLLISIWGNDFTLHAPATQKTRFLTKKTMDLADGLHTDCFRDQELARVWGFDMTKPRIVLPGSGGIQMDIFYPSKNQIKPVVINPRGFRTYVQNDIFFQAIPKVLAHYPQTRFLCPDTGNKPEAHYWVDTLGIETETQLLPRQTRNKMAELFRESKVVVSPTTHDGSPNTVLEAMACGCLPVVGDLESLREWIVPGVNGLLTNPKDPDEMADAICEALGNSALRKQARKINVEMIRERAEYNGVMGKAEDFYRQLISSK